MAIILHLAQKHSGSFSCKTTPKSVKIVFDPFLTASHHHLCRKKRNTVRVSDVVMYTLMFGWWVGCVLLPSVACCSQYFTDF